MRILGAVISLGLLCGGAIPANADAPLSEFYKTCLASKGSPVSIRPGMGSGRFEGERLAEISITVSPESKGKLYVSRNTNFSGGVSALIIGAGASLNFTGTLAKISLRDGTTEDVDYCLRVRVL